MFRDLLKHDVASLVLRLGLGILFIVHGCLKVLDNGGTTWFAGEFLPKAVQALVAWGELVGGVALLLGLLTRLASVGIIVIMCGAIYTVEWKLDSIPRKYRPPAEGYNPFVVSWDFNFAIIMMCLGLIVLGGGLYSADYCLWGRRRERTQAQPAGTSPSVAAPV
ncbi:MAG TPA: DoxX family protein [Gemmataceae bacterium]|jgi:putative oxidoreductase|nr:DoxX family protein [Gemmataceae bacterium]